MKRSDWKVMSSADVRRTSASSSDVLICSVKTSLASSCYTPLAMHESPALTRSAQLEISARHAPTGTQCFHTATHGAFTRCNRRGDRRRDRLNTYGRRAFSVAVPMAWNSLTDFIRDLTSSTDCFRRLLKTYLFARY